MRRLSDSRDTDNGMNFVVKVHFFPSHTITLIKMSTSTPTITIPRIPVPALEDVIEKDDQSPPKSKSRPNSGTVPSSPILTTTLSSPRQSSVRFSSSHSNSGSLPSLPSTSSLSGNTSPNPGPFRPVMPNRISSRPGSSYASAVQYKRPISSGSTLFTRRAWPSTKLRGEIEKPWRKYPDPAHRWGKVIFWSLVGLGFAVGALCTSFRLCSWDPARWTAIIETVKADDQSSISGYEGCLNPASCEYQ
jgi:hypothetical protein